MNWREYWNRDTPIYVGERHKVLHYQSIASDIAALVPSPEAHVLDHGCGEALSAGRVATRCARLYLCDAAPLVRERLSARFGGNPKIEVLAPEEIGRLEDGSLDLVVANSLLQYLSRDELRGLLRLWRLKLKGDGRLALADVIPPDLSPLTDAKALLGFAWKGGFAARAVLGLIRTALSDYRKIRRELGLSTYAESEIIALLRAEGFSAERLHKNIGHNQARMTFEARPA
ncbi:MAG TPA: methyltransferase domain-containing protein [Beijerinckiaceae bacterium]|jgi:SAM-dependent methyltransferase